MAGVKTGLIIEGGREFRASVKRAEPKLLDEIKDAHAGAATFVAGAAQPRSPHRTGRLGGTVRGAGTKTAAIIRAGRASVPYAAPIHFGWPARNIDPHPWISDTAQDTEPTWSVMYEGAVSRVLDTIRGK